VCIDADGGDAVVREFLAHTPGVDELVTWLRQCHITTIALEASGAYLRRQRSRLGAPKAITATAHKLARIIYQLMRHGESYRRKEEAAYAEQVRERLEKQFHRRAKELGFEVKRVQEVVTSEGEVMVV
jgi:hypothetical protein